MFPAALAPVKPRFVSAATGNYLSLEEELRTLLEQRGHGVLWLVGPPGSGKSTALAHLAAIFAEEQTLRLVDEGDFGRGVEQWSASQLVICAAKQSDSLPGAQSLALARWGRDEFVEYLLATHPAKCQPVMSRISLDDELELDGIPELWRVALDELAVDPILPDARGALLHYLHVQLQQVGQWEPALSACLEMVALPTAGRPRTAAFQPLKTCPDVFRLLRHEPVRRLLATECLAAELRRGAADCHLNWQLPREVVRSVGPRITADLSAIARLQAALRVTEQQAMAASLLHAAYSSWTPPTDWRLNLDGAYLDGVRWPGLRLVDASFCVADLSGADLRRADLTRAIATRANFGAALLNKAILNEWDAYQADLSDADLTGVQAVRARFMSADLSGAVLEDATLGRAFFSFANLCGASFRGAQLARADFVNATLEDTDFTDANLAEARFTGGDMRNTGLDGACLRKASLVKCNLEGLPLDGIDLSGANLDGALLTGTSMAGGNLANANLQNTGLADVEWEGVCLRGADLRGATFHMGSSRSGMVFSPIACEGSRTGFYTDDYTEQDFKAPEEIRKANLCGADLRDAKIDNVDFYLVDLRGALYDDNQAQHFRRCGAILEDRCRS